MAYTVARLITESFQLSGLINPGLQSISGSQIKQGLNLLNAILAVKTVDSRLIPYFKEYTFNAVVGQEEYFIPNLIYIETLTFEYSEVRWSMTPLTRRVYQGAARANNIESLMFNYYVERCKGGANLFMYFLPDQSYPCTIWGKFSLDSVVLSQDLEATLDTFYIEFLRYSLAEYICHANNVTFQPQNKAKLEEFEETFLDTSAPDLSIKKYSGLTGKGQSIWGQVNLGHGWTTE